MTADRSTEQRANREALWRVELHCHTIYSKDSLINLEKLPQIARQAGLDRIVITDHNVARGALRAAEMFPDLVIPGEEVMTAEGELLAWHIQEEVPPRLPAAEAIERLREQGAVIGVAHPFDRYRGGAWNRAELLKIVDLLDAIEVFNARCVHSQDNEAAFAFAQEHGKMMTAGSDAHTPGEYGRAVMLMPPFDATVESFRSALAEASRDATLSSFFVHFGSTYAKWVKRLFPSQRRSGG